MAGGDVGVLGGGDAGIAAWNVYAQKIQDAWGELPDYVIKHRRGSMPRVPEKYRRYLDALIKQTHELKRKKK